MRNVLILTCLGLCLAAFDQRSALAATTPRWKVVGNTSNKDWGAVRINTATGEAWLGDENFNWVFIPETGAAPASGDAGTFDCIVLFPAESDSYDCIRWNEHTGQSWYLSEGKWKDAPVKEKEAEK